MEFWLQRLRVVGCGVRLRRLAGAWIIGIGVLAFWSAGPVARADDDETRSVWVLNRGDTTLYVAMVWEGSWNSHGEGWMVIEPGKSGEVTQVARTVTHDLALGFGIRNAQGVFGAVQYRVGSARGTVRSTDMKFPVRLEGWEYNGPILGGLKALSEEREGFMMMPFSFIIDCAMGGTLDITVEINKSSAVIPLGDQAAAAAATPAAPAIPPPDLSVRQPIVPGAWEDLSFAGYAMILGAVQWAIPLDEAAQKKLGKAKTIRSLELPFYRHGGLIEAVLPAEQGDAPDFLESLVILFESDGKSSSAVVLNGQGASILAMNDKAGLQIDTEERARAYLKFFVNSLGGRDRAFRVVENVGEYQWAERPSPAFLGAASGAAQPMQVTRLDGGGWSAWATVEDAGQIYRARFTLSPDGKVAIAEEHELFRLPTAAQKFDGMVRKVALPSK